MSFMNMDQAYVANTYRRFPVEIVSGKGSRLVDINGKSYVDMGSGIGVTAFGFGDEVWNAAVTEQLGKVQHTSNLYYTEPCAKLAKALCEKTGMKKVFFGNSGAEANECAIKVARKYSAMKKGAEYYTIVTLWQSFHGRTLTTLAATGQDHFHKDFQPLTPGFVHVHANDIEELKAALNVADIQTVEAFTNRTRKYEDPTTHVMVEKKLLGLFVNMKDYQVGCAKKGEIAEFSDFDIDYNKEKLLIETRMSGALIKVKSAIALEEDVTAE